MSVTSFDSPGEHPLSRVEILEECDGIFSLRLLDEAGGNRLSAALIGEICQALQALRSTSSLKVLLLEGTASRFAHGDRDEYNEAVRQGLYQSIAEFPAPIIAAMRGDATGAGFLLGTLCDFMVCSESARYEYGGVQSGWWASEAEERVFTRRFGAARALQLLHAGSPSTGLALREKGWTCPIVLSRRWKRTPASWR